MQPQDPQAQTQDGMAQVNPAPQQNPMPADPNPAQPQAQTPVQSNPAPQQPQAQQPVQKIDDGFLQSVGLGALPPQERQDMILQLEKTLQVNVGMEIYKHFNEEQIREFEGMMPMNDENGTVILSQQDAYQNCLRWMDVNVSGYRTNPSIAPIVNDMPALTQTAAQYWLQKNFPGYREVVFGEQQKLMDEVRNNVPQIIAAVNGSQQPQAAVPAQPGAYPPAPQQ